MFLNCLSNIVLELCVKSYRGTLNDPSLGRLGLEPAPSDRILVVSVKISWLEGFVCNKKVSLSLRHLKVFSRTWFLLGKKGKGGKEAFFFLVIILLRWGPTFSKECTESPSILWFHESWLWMQQNGLKGIHGGGVGVKPRSEDGWTMTVRKDNCSANYVMFSSDGMWTNFLPSTLSTT